MDYDFTFNHYKEVITKALEAGYTFYTFSEYHAKKPKGKTFLLRHDVDNFFERAAGFARVEDELGVKATYFLRVHTHYNPFEYNNYALLKRLESAGHELGLHTEASEFAAMHGAEKPDALLAREKAFLEACLGHEVHGLAPHRDINYAANTLPLLQGMDLAAMGFDYQAYEDVFVKESKYVSERIDGHIGWYEHGPEEYIDKFDKITLLTHPQWWFEKHPREGRIA